MEISTTNPEEATYLEDWDVCASVDGNGNPQTWLKNRSKAVWTLPGISWNDELAYTRSTDPGHEVQVDVFHEVVSESSQWGQTMYLTPGTAVRLALDPQSVTWELDLPLTIAWEGQGALLAKFKDVGTSAFIEVTTPKNSANRATLVCTASILDYASDNANLDSEDAGEVVLAALTGVNTVYDCSGASRRATVTLPDGHVDTVHGSVIAKLHPNGPLIGKVTTTVKPFQGTIEGLIVKIINVVK